ncbi:BZ3500_MvSof-1268-A1-R1_Chr6-2g08438 [Microbotryum saponariae]|uniref:BZ3500_MvSof-1268-A1-R1_Chr6-2g08438 protein n=1 Tax=Microbotryum saponariae TaxID=289078 RepID=A0A2X0MEK7_9BASI|nr:BZ3500_MvSof-1268-A1-R1_Chr6-2g08438 [Microbotryum saponariae]SDA07715.1 BZ3501_MvSof-1269-A2-R1_Chr6-1g08152 [Microbotryum saponariae]
MARTTPPPIGRSDFVILPLAVFLYLSAYLDRGNMGSARLQGLQKEVLDNSDTKYSIALSCFFITYIVFSIPGTLLAKAINPSTSISIGALIWSIAATCQAAAKTPGGLYTARLFVGLGEAMFGQAMAFHLTWVCETKRSISRRLGELTCLMLKKMKHSLWYTKKELAKRVGLFISAGATAGAFSGLIAYGVAHIHNTKLEQWRILFLIEGLPSLALAVVVFFCLPSRPSISKFLNEDERTLAHTRLNEQSSFEASSGIEWSGVRHAFFDWKTYAFAVMFSCMNLTLGSVGGFLPTIIKGLGYSNANAQLFSVPPYVVALVFMLLLSSFSDRKQTRGIPVASVFVVGIIGWALLLTIPAHKATHTQLHVRYFGCICIVTAGYSAIPLIISWVSANTGTESQRAVSLGMLNAIGQCLSVLAAFSFPTIQGPQYRKGIIINLAFEALGFVMAIALSLYFRAVNSRRDRSEGEPQKGVALNTHEDYDHAEGFRYVV